MKNLTVHDGKTPIYNIILARSFDELPQAVKALGLSGRRVCIVSETNVAPYYMTQVTELFSGLADTVINFCFQAGEASKNLNTVEQLYETLIKSKFDRKDLLVALGGGVVGDLTGYTAATYLRGIDFIQLPTSLLAQVDSSIGGKTGVDFNAYKNMVGAFHQPRLVYINLSTLLTLNRRQYISGMGEIIKHGLIKNKDYYDWLKANVDSIVNRDLNILEQMIYMSCCIKRDVVEHDPKEQGERALLNFGHTIGHAVEKLWNFKLLHGECVALGCVGASYISMKKGYISKAVYEDICHTLKNFELPVSVTAPDGILAQTIVEATKLDKKMESGQIKFILLKPEGNGVIDRTVNDTQMLEAVNCMIKLS